MSKSAYLEFIEANEALLNCYAEVNIEEYKNEHPGKSSGLCMEHKTKIRNILQANALNMT